MKILIISPHPGFGGASTANINIAKTLALAGHEVIYMDEYRKDIHCIESITLDDYPIHKNGFLKQIKTYKYLMSLNPDYLMFGIPIIGVYLLPILCFLRLQGKQIGCIFHSLSLQQSLKNSFLEFLISIFTTICNHLVFVSQYTVDSWSKYLLIKYHRNKKVIYNSIQQIRKKEYEEHKTKKIAFIGRFSNEKQPVLFCQVAELYTKQKLDVEFFAWGDGPILAQCKNKYSQYVHFMGYASDIEQIYDSIDILLVTSQFENCPMVILEAASNGIPVVAPAVGGIPEMITSSLNGELYNEFDISKICKSISLVIDNYYNYRNEILEWAKLNTFGESVKKWNEILP